MSEELFRIGGVYRQNDGRLVRLVEIRDGDHLRKTSAKFGARMVSVYFVHGDSNNGWRRLDNGMYPWVAEEPDYESHLVPGELHCVNGEWLPITPVVEEKKEAEFLREQRDWLLWGKKPVLIGIDYAEGCGPNARMLANDLKNGPAKPYIKPQEQGEGLGISKAHPPIPGLSLSPDKEGASHRLGGRFGTAH